MILVYRGMPSWRYGGVTFLYIYHLGCWLVVIKHTQVRQHASSACSVRQVKVKAKGAYLGSLCYGSAGFLCVSGHALCATYKHWKQRQYSDGITQYILPYVLKKPMHCGDLSHDSCKKKNASRLLWGNWNQFSVLRTAAWWQLLTSQNLYNRSCYHN